MAQTATAVRNDAGAAEGGQLVVFRLFGEEFGVDIDRVKEIVRPPVMTPIPRSPDFVAGVCNLRGNVLPVIDTRVRFGAETEGATDHTRLLVVESGGVNTGLIVDSMREVMRMTDAQLEPPPAACKGVDRQFLDGVVKVDDGRRLIMVLDLDEVLAVEAADARALEGDAAPAAAGTGDPAGAEAVAEEQQLVSFRVAGDEYAFDIAQVSEIIKITHITTVPNVPSFVKGLFTIRNHLMPIIDLRELLGLPGLASERDAVVEAALTEHRDWVDNLSHALTADRPFTGTLAAKETAFGKWLEAYNSSSIEVETVVKRLKRARADLFGSGVRVLNERKTDPAAAGAMFEERTRPLLSVVLDELAALKSTMKRHLLADQRALVMECGTDDGDSSDSVGFLVDWVDEVLRIPTSVIDDAPTLAASDRAELKAVAKLDNGERLIMIMDESALMSGETSRLVKDIRKKAGKAAEAGSAGGRETERVNMEEEQLVTFTINREEYAIRIMQVQEINRASEITAVPRAPYFVDGMTNLRGNVLPVLNLRKLFGLDDREMDDRTRIIIVDIDDGPGGPAKTGIRVDGVNEVLRLGKGQIEKTPSIVVSGSANRYMEGVCKIDGGSRIIVLLDVEKILDEKELKALGDIAEEQGAEPPASIRKREAKTAAAPEETETGAKGKAAGKKKPASGGKSGGGKKKKLEIAE